MKQGLYIRYDLHGRGYVLSKISQYRFPGGDFITAHNKTAPEGKVYTLKCLCGGNDWNDNGRFVNEHECSCCGEFVEVYYD